MKRPFKEAFCTLANENPKAKQYATDAASSTRPLKRHYFQVKNIMWIALLTILVISSCHAPKELIYQNVENFSVKQSGQNKTQLAMDIRLYNPNRYTMKLKSADVDVFLNNNPIGKLNANKQCALPAKDTFSLPVTLEVDLKSVLPNVLQLLFNSEVDVKLTGNIKAGRHGIYLNIPVSYEGKQDILSGLK